jgi:hypothetical protein
MTLYNTDIQKLIDYSIEFAKQLLAQFKEFYPFAAAINRDRELVPILLFEGEEFLVSQDFALRLESLLQEQIKISDKRTYAITTDVLVKRHDFNESRDAISIKIKNSQLVTTSQFFFLYNISNENVVEIIDSWNESIE